MFAGNPPGPVVVYIKSVIFQNFHSRRSGGYGFGRFAGPCGVFPDKIGGVSQLLEGKAVLSAHPFCVPPSVLASFFLYAFLQTVCKGGERLAVHRRASVFLLLFLFRFVGEVDTLAVFYKTG